MLFNVSAGLLLKVNEVVLPFEGLQCPADYHKLPIFADKCNNHLDCKELGELCCREKDWKICRQGILTNAKETQHERKLITQRLHNFFRPSTLTQTVIESAFTSPGTCTEAKTKPVPQNLIEICHKKINKKTLI